MLGDGKETKRKRELIKADSTAEDEDEEEVKEEGSKVKGEPISPPPLRWRLGAKGRLVINRRCYIYSSLWAREQQWQLGVTRWW